MNSVDYLLTLVSKTDSEILDIVSKLNIKGNVLVGNQLSPFEKEYSFEIDDCKVHVFNTTDKGVSKNRNNLLAHSTADYVTFLDDDMYFPLNKEKEIEKIIQENPYDCIRFNVQSDNIERPIKFLTKKGFVSFRDISSFGVCGCFFRRELLINNNLYFNENVGPGTKINHGEDGLFNFIYLKKFKMFSFPLLAFCARQEDSTWHNESNRDIPLELFSHGYLYYLLYGKMAKICSFAFLITHKKCFPKGEKIHRMLKYMRNGIEKSKKENRVI